MSQRPECTIARIEDPNRRSVNYLHDRALIRRTDHRLVQLYVPASCAATSSW